MLAASFHAILWTMLPIEQNTHTTITLAQSKLHLCIKSRRLHIFPSDSWPSRLTNFADFGSPPEMTHRGQVKVTVLVYQSNLSFTGWATLVQSYLHHLQLHMNNDIHTSTKVRGNRGVSDGGTTKDQGKKGNGGERFVPWPNSLSAKCVYVYERER